MGTLVAELEAEEVIDPLAQRFTLAAIWQHLSRLAGEPFPAYAAAVMGDALAQPVGLPVPIPTRGSFADYEHQFGPDAWLSAD